MTTDYGDLVTQYLGLAGKVERLRDTDSTHHPGRDALKRWQTLYTSEIAEVLAQQDRLTTPGDSSGLTADLLTEWISYVNKLLKVVPVTW